MAHERMSLCLETEGAKSQPKAKIATAIMVSTIKKKNMTDNRNTERLRTLLSGVLYDEEGRAWECLISDISEGGARIKSKTEVELEMFVDLKINKFNDVRQTKVMWKRDNYTGLQFTVKIDKDKGPMSEFFKLMQHRDAPPSSMAKPSSTDNLMTNLNKLVA